MASLFAQVLLVCDRQGLIGREMLAIDGVKFPSNASKQKSGSRADYQRQLDKMEVATHKMIAQQKNADTAPTDEARVKRELLRLDRLHTEACHLRDWFTTRPEDRIGAKGAMRLSNRTDNGSAKMDTSKGVIQGYTGVAAVDEKTQINVEAQASGTGSEQELLLPIVKAFAALRTSETVITADAGYHSEANLQALAETSCEAYAPDNGCRKRDAQYAYQGIHTAKLDPLWDKAKTPGKAQCFIPQDFQLAEDRTHCICSAGKRLYGNGSNCTFNGFAAIKFLGAKQDYLPCARRHECLHTPEKTKTRQVAFFQGKCPEHKSFPTG